MYSLSNLPVDKVIPESAVDKGLGFDFSAIADFVKTAATTGLNIYKQQATIQQTKALAASNPYVQIPNPVGIGQPNPYGLTQTILPLAQAYGYQPNIPQPATMYGQPSSGIGTGTMLMIGGVLVGGIVLFKLLKG